MKSENESKAKKIWNSPFFLSQKESNTKQVKKYRYLFDKN